MALDSLKFGSFRPTRVEPEARCLPGFGGQAEEWANYKFQIKALEKKEAPMTDTERRKLGPLGLRLVERLQGPALQVAKTLGIDTLAESGGVDTLLSALEKELLPLRRQLALELYQAGASSGPLSRQYGEQMSSYLLRREAWWNQLQELDSEVQCSKAILGEQLLLQSGVTSMEQQLIRSTMNNDLADLKKLSATLRDQFGGVHDRERGKGRGKSEHKGRWNWNKGYHSYMAESSAGGDESTTAYPEGGTTYEESEVWDYNEDYHDENEEWPMDTAEEETRLEEDIVSWYADQGLHAQTCSPEDLELIYDTVESESLAFFARQQAASRGHTVPAGNRAYQGGQGTPQERQSRVLAAKQRTRCRACGQQGHWQRDWICPKRRQGKGFGKSKGFGKGKTKKGTSKTKADDKPSGGSSGGSSPTGKPRVVYFSVRNEETEQPFAGMTMRGEPYGPVPLDGELDEEDAAQRRMDHEVRRLMRLPQEELDRRFQQELAFTPPTSKSRMPQPPEGMLWQEMSSRTSSVAPDDERPRPTASLAETCQHEQTTKRGSNGYIDMVSCKQCGKILEKKPKVGAKDQKMRTKTKEDCTHQNVSWHGTNGHVWMWTCQDCGQMEKIPKSCCKSRPVPGQPRASGEEGSRDAASSNQRIPDTPSRMMQDDREMFVNEEDWVQYQGLLSRMVTSHMAIHGTVTGSEFMHLVQATTLCYQTLAAPAREQVVPQAFSRSTATTPLRMTTMTTSGRSSAASPEQAGDRIFSFGKYKGRSFRRVFDQDEEYVEWTMREADVSDGWCAGMRHWMEYCRLRLREREEEDVRRAYMALDNVPMDDDEEGTFLFLDSGCNQTCHGELWLQRFREITGYTPDWLHEQRRSLRGIGGSTETLGERQFYVSFENVMGQSIPGEVSSTEIAGSTAPLLLSLPSQEALGLVVDFETSEIYSKLLGMSFRAVRGKKNNLLGLKMKPADVTMEDHVISSPVALMAEDEEAEEKKSGLEKAARGPVHYLGLGFTHEVRQVPKRRRREGEEEEASSSSAARPIPTTAPTMTPAEEAEAEEEMITVPVEEEENEEEAAEQAEEGYWEEAPVSPGEPEAEQPTRAERDEEEEYEPSDPEDENVENAESEDPDDDDPTVPARGIHEDWWDRTDFCIVRHHIEERTKLFYPEGGRMNLPIDISRLEDSRVTVKHYESGEVTVVRDNWRVRPQDHLIKSTWQVERFQKGPAGARICRRITTNYETGRVIADETEEELLDPERVTRKLPGGRQNIQSEFYFIEEEEDVCAWTGTTTFKIKPLDRGMEVEICDLDQEREHRKVLTKGQRKNLEKEITAVEDTDMAMWSAVHKNPTPLRKRSILFELFCGCALLTRPISAPFSSKAASSRTFHASDPHGFSSKLYPPRFRCFSTMRQIHRITGIHFLLSSWTFSWSGFSRWNALHGPQGNPNAMSTGCSLSKTSSA